MESKWYFFPGQTVENTKISDRAHALHITASSWKNITQHLDRKKRIQEALDKERAYKESLKKGSEAMTKQWEDSIENIRRRKDEERNQRFNKSAEDKVQEYYEMRADQEAVRKEYVEKIKKEVFTSTGYPKQLTSALVLSETLYERDKQKEFNQKLKEHEIDVKNKQDKQIIERDEQHKKEDKEKRMEIAENRKKMAQTLKEQIRENEETRKANNKARVERDTEDRIKAAIEEELLKKYQFEEHVRKRREMAADRKGAIADERKRQEIQAKEDAEMEKATQFYSEAKKRIDCMMTLKEKQMREDQIKQREELARKIAKIKGDNEIREQERIAKSIAEKEAAEIKRKEDRAIYEAKAIQESVEDRRAFLKRQEEEKLVENELKRWEMLNRCKTAEVMKDYNEQNRRDRWQQILQYRKDLLEQMADDEEIRKQEKEIDRIMSHVSYEENDKMFFEYANEVLELAKKKNRSTYPIEKVIFEYKKVHNMLPKNNPCRCCTRKQYPK